MAINSIKLENFTVFENIKCDFSPGINIFIGENGTGKTHLLKVLYAFCSCKTFYDDAADEPTKLKDDFFTVLKKCFQDKSIAQLFTHESKTMKISVDSDNGFYLFPVTTVKQKNGDTTNVVGVTYSMLENEKLPITATFLTAKEMLSHSRGLTSLYNEYELSFDTTQIDIISKAQFPVARSVPSIAKNILPHLEDILDGKVVEENDEFFIVKRSGRKIPFALEAEGIKKIGALWKLLMSKRITTDSILFWDEPEANINPTIMPIVVETLLELSRQGVQVFLATHEYNMMKYFSVKKKDSDQVAFISLKKSQDGVVSESEEDYNLLEHNPIVAANIKLVEANIEGVF